MDKRKTLTVCAGILVAGVVLTTITFMTEPTAKREAATRKSAMLVDVLEVDRGDYRPTIVAMGTVQPSRDVTLSPRVGGEIVTRSPAFVPGGFAKKGELLLQIDPADYQNRLQQRRSDLRQAVSDLNVEMGRQNVAQKDYQLLDETLSAELESLVLRKPQLNSARARVESARAAVVQAELELERTNIRAPFDVHILSRRADVGSQVSAGDNLGRIVGEDTYWVEATVPLSRLPWLSFPETEDETGTEVRIRNHSAWPEGVYRLGALYRLVGALEDRTRMARVLISVPDPLSHLPEYSSLPPMMIGSYVEVQIEAAPLRSVVKLSRDLIRANDTVWIMDNEKLRIQSVEIVFKDADHAYISRGLEHGDLLVVTSLSTIRDGSDLRARNAPPEGGDS